MTKESKESRVRYDEGCLAAHALNLIGDRWALLVVRELMFSAKRFQMIRAGLPGITASVLTGRLAQLQAADVLNYDERLGIYALTDAGCALRPVLESLCRWALLVPGHDPTRFISPSALMISMRVNLLTDRAARRQESAGFDFGGEAFEMRLAGGQLQTLAVIRPEAPVVFSGSGNTLAAAVYGTVSVRGLIDRHVIEATGDLAAAQNFVNLFRLKPEA